MKGKSKCKILKDIRRRIAEENGIDYVTTDCKYQGDCTGTCPKCEAEVRYLEDELEKRRNAGKSVLVAGIAASMVLAMPGCAASETPAGTSPVQPSTELTQPLPSQSDPTHVENVGEIYIPESSVATEESVTMGEPTTEPSETYPELMGIPIPGEVPGLKETEETVPPIQGDIPMPTEFPEEFMGEPVMEYLPDGF
jgi:hypothetical protein